MAIEDWIPCDFYDEFDFAYYRPECKYCGAEIYWVNYNSKWIPYDSSTEARHVCPERNAASVDEFPTLTTLNPTEGA
jgi:hypothetical protein